MRKHMLVDTLISQICDRYPPTLRVDLAFRDGAFGIYTNSRDIVELLSTEYGSMVSHGARTSRILTILDTPPFQLDRDVLKLANGGSIAVGACELDLLDGGVERDIQTGILYLISNDRDVIIGPCAREHDEVIDFVFNRYQAWVTAHTSRRRSRPRCGPSAYR
jgi:hypothetical protein